MYLTLPKVTPDLYRISIVRVFDSNDKNFFVMPYYKTILMSIQIRYLCDFTIGENIIFDLRNTTFSYFKQFTLPVMKKAFVILMVKPSWDIYVFNYLYYTYCIFTESLQCESWKFTFCICTINI